MKRSNTAKSVYNSRIINYSSVLGCILLITFLSTTAAFAFNGVALKKMRFPDRAAITVSGKVTDEKGDPLSGVSILEKGTSNGVTTLEDGTFRITVKNNNALLDITSVGYVSQEVAVKNQLNIIVVLQSTTSKMDEVVVVGYGTQSKRNMTGAVSSVNSKDLASISTDNVVSGLAGRLPGLRVKQGSSEPGSFSAKFDIRGLGNPLIVIDGMVSDAETFTRLNTNDIDQISILKDASAAIYGVQAANGVVLVKTKKGIAGGKPTITYSGQYQIQQVTNTPKANDAYGYAVLTTEAEINSGRSANATTYTAEDFQKFKDGTYPSTDWYGLVVRKSMPAQHHDLNISGGNDKIRYFASAGYLSEMGLWKSGDLNYKKYNVRSNIVSKIAKNLEAELNLSGMLDEKNEPSAPAEQQIGGAFFSLFMQNPTQPVYANNNPGYLSEAFDGQHPLAITNASIGGYNKGQTKTFQGIFTLNYKVPFIEGLNAKFMYGNYYQELFQKTWLPKFLMYSYDNQSGEYINTAIKNNPSNLTGDYQSLRRSNLLTQLDYDRTIQNIHTIKASLAFEEREEATDNLWAKKEFAIDLDQFFAGVSENAQVDSKNIYKTANQSVIGKLNYGFKSKYLIEAGFNYGGSSKFPSGKRWGFFPYGSVGWRISGEPFFQKTFPYISDLKIRGSLGQIGDDNAAAFQYMTGYTYPNNNYVFNGAVVPGLGFKGVPNPNITWFTVTSKNIGFDMDVKHGLLTVQFDYFQRLRSGLLTTRALTIPTEVGANLPQENLNRDMRKGIEIVLGHSKRTGSFQYDFSGNFTYSRGRALHVERADDLNSYLNWRNNTTDRWDNIVWGYKYIGQFQSNDEILNSPLQDNSGNSTLRPGDLKYEDVNGDGIIDASDIVPIARGDMPDINFGLSGNLRYKQFDLNFLLQGAANFKYQLQGWYMNKPQPWAGRNGLAYFMDRWHHEDIYDVNSPWVPGAFPSSSYPPSNSWNSDFWIRDASYVRLKNMELGYTFNKSLLLRAGIQRVRIWVGAYNLFTLTKLKYVDPERSTELTYPITKTYNFGLTLTL